ncbi:MAG TPA: hypothetical protein PK304_07955 [Mobilitalea sp.]|nr:hypothetical protein [Mobilitalea sp.]
MSKSNLEHNENGTSIRITVDITKIVKYLCFAGVIIVGIIFGSKCFQNMLKEGLIEVE